MKRAIPLILSLSTALLNCQNATSELMGGNKASNDDKTEPDNTPPAEVSEPESPSVVIPTDVSGTFLYAGYFGDDPQNKKVSLWVESPDKSITLKSVLKDPETDCSAVAKSSLPVYQGEQEPIKDQLLVGEMDSTPQRIHFNKIDQKIIYLNLVDLKCTLLNDSTVIIPIDSPQVPAAQLGNTVAMTLLGNNGATQSAPTPTWPTFQASENGVYRVSYIRNQFNRGIAQNGNQLANTTEVAAFQGSEPVFNTQSGGGMNMKQALFNFGTGPGPGGKEAEQVTLERVRQYGEVILSAGERISVTCRDASPSDFIGNNGSVDIEIAKVGY